MRAIQGAANGQKNPVNSPSFDTEWRPANELNSEKVPTTPSRWRNEALELHVGPRGGLLTRALAADSSDSGPRTSPSEDCLATGRAPPNAFDAKPDVERSAGGRSPGKRASARAAPDRRGQLGRAAKMLTGPPAMAAGNAQIVANAAGLRAAGWMSSTAGSMPGKLREALRFQKRA